MNVKVVRQWKPLCMSKCVVPGSVVCRYTINRLYSVHISTGTYAVFNGHYEIEASLLLLLQGPFTPCDYGIGVQKYYS